MKGFTLLELLVTIFVGAMIFGILIIILNPQELLAQARDSRRVADIEQLKLALSTYINSGVTVDMDGPNYSNSCKDQSSPKLFVSIPQGEGGTPVNLPPNWALVQRPASVVSQINGNGWIPVNFSAAAGGPAITSLPLDPTNSFEQNLFYGYSCKANNDFELTAYLESEKYNNAQKEAKNREDHGTDPVLFEDGADLSLDPLSPVGYWSFDEGTGTTTYDISGGGNNGTLNGFDFSGGSNWTDGKDSKALSFDGLNDYVNISSINPTTTLSLAFWLKSPSSSYNTLWSAFSKYNAFVLGPSDNNTKTVCFIVYITASGGWTPWPPTEGTNCYTVGDASSWHQFVGTFNSSAGQLKLYVDGILRATGSASGSIDNDTGPINLGHRECSGCTEYFSGIIDEVLIYNRTLSAQEVSALYHAQK